MSEEGVRDSEDGRGKWMDGKEHSGVGLGSESKNSKDDRVSVQSTKQKQKNS